MSIVSTPPRANFVADLADPIIGASSLEGLVRPLLELLETVTGLESTYMTTIDRSAGVQHVLYSRNSRRLQIPEGLSVPWSETLCKRAMDEGRSYADDVPERWGDSEAARALGITSYASMPILGAGGEVHGTLCGVSQERVPMRNDADRIMRMFSHLISLQVERDQLMRALHAANEQLAHSAMTDSGTGLPNRRALMDELARRLRHRERDGGHVLIAFIDLDGFKLINDAHGHDVGDQFLAAIAKALAGSLRADDFCARLGGDEFVVLASTQTGAMGQEEALRDRIERATAGRFDLGGGTIDYAGASVGVVTATEGDHEAESQLARADAAMYEIKRARRDAGGYLVSVGSVC